MALRVLLVLLLSTSLSAQVYRNRLATSQVQDTPPIPSVVITGPTSASVYNTSTASLTVSGNAQDNVSVASVTWACPQCSVTSGTADLVVSGTTATWSFLVTLASGANVITVTATDGSANPSVPDVLTATLVAGGSDVEVPQVVIQTNGGANHNVTTASVTLTGVCTDNVACTSIAWAITDGPSGNCGGEASWTCNVDLLATNGQTTANAITITARDEALNEGTDTITVTRVVAVTWVTPANLQTVNIAATSRVLSCAGGTGDIDYAVTAGDIGDGDLNEETGELTYPDVEDTYTFTVTCTDGAAETEPQDFTLIVDDAAETSHAYYEGLIARPDLIYERSLRDHRQIDPLTPNATPSVQYFYKYPGADPEVCYQNNCNDTDEMLDAMKLEPPIIPCDPKDKDRPIQSTSATNPSTMIVEGNGLNVKSVYTVTFSNHTYEPLNTGTYTFTVTSKDSTVTPTLNTGTLNALGGGTAGRGIFVDVADACEGSDDAGSREKPVFHTDVPVHSDTVGSLFVTFDWWYDTTWRQFNLFKKMWAWNQFSNNPGGESTVKGTFEQHSGDTNINLPVGNGAGNTSIGVADQHGPTRLLAPGQVEADHYLRQGEGGVSGALTQPLNANFHVQTGVWTRYFHLLDFHVRLSDAKFDKWRAYTGIGDGKFGIDTCTVAGTTTTCTMTEQWIGTGAGGNPNFTVGTEIWLEIEGNAGTNLNGTRLASVLTATSFSFTTPSGGATGAGGTMDPYFTRESTWIADENRAATRITFGIPVLSRVDSYWYMVWGMDTSAVTGTRTEDMFAYTRNLVILYSENDLLDLDLSGTCNTTDPPLEPTTSDRGHCTVDATNNPTILKKPVR